MRHAAQLSRLARFVLAPAQWDATAAAWARVLPCDAPGSLVGRLEAEVKAGRARVCRMLRDGAHVGYIVFTGTDSNELLVHAAFSGVDHADLMTEAMPALYSLARQCECSTIRFHTMRAGMIAKAQRHGFRVSEVIMRKDVP